MFVSSLVSLLFVPWLVTLALCPHALEAYRTVDRALLLKVNLFSVLWGVANLLCALSYLRVGFVLGGGILTGVSVSIGSVVPMVIKGSGLFKSAPNLDSPSGWTVLMGVTVTLFGVLCVSLAGFGRERDANNSVGHSGNFLVGLATATLTGICAVGLSFSFVYGQGPIISAMKARGAGDIGANFAVWSVGLFGAALLCILYPAYLITKGRSWHVLANSWPEAMWFVVMGTAGCLGITLMGKGMIILGSFGASVGYGIQRSSTLLGSAGVGFVSGEWSNVTGAPRQQVTLGIIVLILGVIVLGYGNSLS
jgi:L-rhamnose-H+ transport protein